MVCDILEFVYNLILNRWIIYGFFFRFLINRKLSELRKNSRELPYNIVRSRSMRPEPVCEVYTMNIFIFYVSIVQMNAVADVIPEKLVGSRLTCFINQSVD